MLDSAQCPLLRAMTIAGQFREAHSISIWPILGGPILGRPQFWDTHRILEFRQKIPVPKFREKFRDTHQISEIRSSGKSRGRFRGRFRGPFPGAVSGTPIESGHLRDGGGILGLEEFLDSH